MSELDMRQRNTLLKGGKGGQVLIPGNAEKSRLFMAAAHIGELQMPPSQPPLSEKDLSVLREWIDKGAPWSVKDPSIASESSWWSFRKPRRPVIPETTNDSWVKNPIDAFIVAKLKDNALNPAPRANKEKLIRRAYFDLIGLPPTPEQIENFLKDSSSQAYEKMIKSLLDSPHYGERWARHWLDIVRYSDSSGFESDHYYPNAWRYRDYVIKSFNDDKPYDRFLQEQIAGDELWPDRFELTGLRTIPFKKMEYLEARIGTGLYTFGPEILESRQDAEQWRSEELSDWADTTGSAFLGLTIGCARCHDHKFDPITQRDYYSFQAIFENSRQTEISLFSPIQEVSRNLSYSTVVAVETSRLAYRLFQKKVKDRIQEEKKKLFPSEVVEAFEIEKSQRTPKQEKLAKPLIEAIKSMKIDEVLTTKEREQKQELLNTLANAVLRVAELEGSNLSKFEGLLEIPKASVLGHFEAELAPPVHVLNRGQFREKLEKSTAKLLSCFNQTTNFKNIFSNAKETRQRKQLALWLTRPDNPLTTRVIVNRIWQWHMGQALVRTPNNFGINGEKPSHPKLLDWLAIEFMDRGWSMKSMHWLIMTSNTYQMSSLHNNPKAHLLDPANTLLWRMNRRRLEGEELWDSMVSIAGVLKLELYGRSIVPPLSKEDLDGKYKLKQWGNVTSDPEQYRRGIYFLSQRNFIFPMFEAFDNPQNATSCPQRDVTTVAPQALWFLNNRTAFKQAGSFAARLVKRNGENMSNWVIDAWKLSFGRPPSDQEKQEALELLTNRSHQIKKERWTELSAGLEKIPVAKASALTEFCLALFNLNEFLYID